MPLQPGEVSLLTLFADVHYIFSPPHVKPPHHRFEKTSYVYLYHNPIQRRGRIEIANNPGSQDQDVLLGYLDNVVVERSHKHPTLFTITVNGGQTTPGQQQDMSQWHLPAADMRNEGKYMYRLASLDIYFWTVEDSNLFLDSLGRVLQEHQLRILDAPNAPTEHRDTMSSVVQKLEQAAISSPYQGRSNSIGTTQSFPPPPSAPTPGSVGSRQPTEPPANFTPMAYNPAAPAAPEPIAHREPTPPPPDADAGTGLAAAELHDHGAHFQPPGTYPQQQQPYVPGPPGRSNSFPPPPAMTGTPPAPGVQRSNTATSFPPPPPAGPSSTTPQSQPYTQPSFAPPPPQEAQVPYSPGHPPTTTTSTSTTQYASYPPQSPGFPPPMQSPGYASPPTTITHTPLHSPAFPPTAPSGYHPLHQQQQQQPVQSPAGFSSYPYSGSPGTSTPAAAAAGVAAVTDPYAVHAQAYRPTEAEVKPAGGKMEVGQPQQAGPGQQQQPRRLEARLDRVEKGVSRFLKRLDRSL